MRSVDTSKSPREKDRLQRRARQSTSSAMEGSLKWFLTKPGCWFGTGTANVMVGSHPRRGSVRFTPIVDISVSLDQNWSPWASQSSRSTASVRVRAPRFCTIWVSVDSHEASTFYWYLPRIIPGDNGMEHGESVPIPQPVVGVPVVAQFAAPQLWSPGLWSHCCLNKGRAARTSIHRGHLSWGPGRTVRAV